MLVTVVTRVVWRWACCTRNVLWSCVANTVLLFSWLCLCPTLAGTVRRLYLQHLISRTPRNRLRAVLRAMASSTSKGSGSSSSSSGGGRSGGGSSKDSGSGGSGSSIPLDIDYLIEHPDEIVPYFTSRDADEILLLLGGLLHSTAPSDARDLTSAQQARLRAAMDSGELSKWIAQKYRNGKDDPDEVCLLLWCAGCCSCPQLLSSLENTNKAYHCHAPLQHRSCAQLHSRPSCHHLPR
jgi:hypothetical protein